ncbi:MAG: hypothetical protein KAI66_09590, partial [Lentisphaeria bacterium]|nr:hypothetical protein [Lentisphaeria bacterium]
ACPKVPVPPIAFAAEHFISRADLIAPVEGGQAAKCAVSKQVFTVMGVPFPRTSQPVTVYVRIQACAPGATLRLQRREPETVQTVSQAKMPSAGWQWVRLGPHTAGEIGTSFALAYWPAKRGRELSAMDKIVLATDPNITDEALDGVPFSDFASPLVEVPRCATPPTLDGKPDDACWTQTVGAANFMLVGTTNPAESATTTRCCYDDANLYLLFECDEPILSVAQQRRHEFSAKVKKHDDKVYRDDSCMMLLDPKRDLSAVFDLTANALGTIEDARCTGDNLWGSRDHAWDSDAMAAGQTHDGSWTMEIRIPFASLGVSCPKDGETWNAAFARIARARRETSSWNESGRGFHEPVRFGRLVFRGTAPPVTMRTPRALSLGKNASTVTTSVTGADKPSVVLLSRIEANQRAIINVQDIVWSPGSQTAECATTLSLEGEARMWHAVLDAATLRPASIAPTVIRKIRSTSATLELASTGPFEVYANGERCAFGPPTTSTKVTIPLQKGLNTIGLHLANGTATVKLIAPGLPPGPVRWKRAPSGNQEARTVKADTSNWETEEAAPDSEGAVTLNAPEPEGALFRHTLVWEHTRAWPTPSPALFVARESPQHLTFIVNGFKQHKLTDWSLLLAVPPQIDVLDATSYYGSRGTLPTFSCEAEGKITLDDADLKLFRIRASMPIVPKNHYIFSVVHVLIQARAESATEKEVETNLQYWTESCDRTTLEPIQNIPVRFMPPLNGRQPKKLVWQLWGSFFGPINKSPMKEALLRTMQAAGINDLVAGDTWTSDNGARYGIGSTRGMNFKSWSLNLKPHLEANPEERLVTVDGTRSDNLACTSRLLGDSWIAVEKQISKQLEELRPTTLDYDFEFGPKDGPHSCYCDDCLAAFRRHAKLPQTAKVTRENLQTTHVEAWVDFMAWRVAQIFLRFKNSIHRLNPGTKFSVYSGYHSEENPKQYGVNWAYVGQLQACDHAACGYGRPVPAVRDTVTALKGIPATYGAIMRPYRTSEIIPQIPMTKARLLRRSIDASGGVLVYDRLPMDGRSWTAIAETTRLVATYEKTFINGKRFEMPGCPEAQVTGIHNSKITLVCLMNETSKKKTIAVTLPDSPTPWREFYSGEAGTSATRVTCTLAPGETAVYVNGQE